MRQGCCFALLCVHHWRFSWPFPQWRRLWAAFGDGDAVLLSHYFNHYALIYALREWRHAQTGVLHRELLTAKPAQRPCRWLAWPELRKWLLQWQGYSVLRFEIAPEMTTAIPAAPPAVGVASAAAARVRGPNR